MQTFLWVKSTAQPLRVRLIERGATSWLDLEDGTGQAPVDHILLFHGGYLSSKQSPVSLSILYILVFLSLPDIGYIIS